MANLGFGKGLDFGLGPARQKTKRKQPSATKKIILWEKDKRHICHVCKDKIYSLRDAHLDHVKAFKNGGVKISWAHAACNLYKGSKGLVAVQKELGVYVPKKRPTKIRVRRKKRNPTPSGLSIRLSKGWP